MTSDTKKTEPSDNDSVLRSVRLCDYRPADWLVDKAQLDIKLHKNATKITTILHMRPNPELAEHGDIVLDGEKIELKEVRYNGTELTAKDYHLDDLRLVIHRRPSECFTIQTDCIVDPCGNSELSGLYRSKNFYCTQCEPEGFRRITYFPDRPDIMCRFQVRLEAETKDNRYLLSNGNCIEQGLCDDDSQRHYAIWQMPMPMPCYLFAVVAGDFDVLEDVYISSISKKKVKLAIYCEKGKKNRVHFAMQSLKNAMLWDEKTYGFEYDLECFMIVAISDFNMGAMENKGLNIFNDKYLLADTAHATDTDYQNIERIVAHEYFHNWTGNRITCRDWFQICLKEGLTVFREQQYCAFRSSFAIERIGDISFLRNKQFIDDAGPLAHPVRPEQYIEINNFYNATVYEKSAEIFRMIALILGDEGYYKGIKQFFADHDGTAASVEDILASMAKANEQYSELLTKEILRWYQQAGTPIVSIRTKYDAKKRYYHLNLTQSLNAPRLDKETQPQPIPLCFGLIEQKSGQDYQNIEIHHAKGCQVKNDMIIMQERQAEVIFKALPSKPYLSILRGFCAPVHLDYQQNSAELAYLATNDKDLPVRWQSINKLAMDYLKSNLTEKNNENHQASVLIDCLKKIIQDQNIEVGIKKLLLTMPGYKDVTLELKNNIAPRQIVLSLTRLHTMIAKSLDAEITEQYQQLSARMAKIAYKPEASQMQSRAYKNYLLWLWAKNYPDQIQSRADRLYQAGDNLTDRLAVIEAVNDIDSPIRQELLQHLIRAPDNRPDELLYDKYLSLQARAKLADSATHIERIMQEDYFQIKNPNRVFSLLGVFAFGNPMGFHAADASGYRLIADVIIRLDDFNPQIAARMLESFSVLHNLEENLRAQMLHFLEAIVRSRKASKNVREIGQKILNGTAKNE